MKKQPHPLSPSPASVPACPLTQRGGTLSRNLLRLGMLAYLLLTVSIAARTKLVTMPQREYTRIDLKNENQTLIEEERTVNLQKGVNHIEYAFSGVSVDMNSVQFRAIKTPGEVRVLNVNYPPGENALFWEVYSEKAGPGAFRLSYLIRNIKRSTAYEAVVDKDEKALTLKAHTMIQNASGENFTKAEMESTLGNPFEGALMQGESKKILSLQASDVHFTKKYFFDNAVSPEVSLLYEVLNEKSAGLPEVQLPYGKARVYQEDSQGSEAFLGEDWAKETGAGQKLELKLGQAKEVRVKRSVVQRKEEIVKLPIKNYRETIKFQIENFKDSAVPLTLVEHPGGEWVIDGIEIKEESGERDSMRENTVSVSVKDERIDTNNLKLHVKVPANGREKKKLNVYVKLVLKNRW